MLRSLVLVMLVAGFAQAEGVKIEKTIETFSKDFWDGKKEKKGAGESVSPKGTKRSVTGGPRFSERENREREEACGALRETDFKTYQICAKKKRAEQLKARDRAIDSVGDKDETKGVPNTVPKEYLPGSYKVKEREQ